MSSVRYPVAGGRSPKNRVSLNATFDDGFYLKATTSFDRMGVGKDDLDNG